MPIGICPIFYHAGQIIDYVTDKPDERNLSGVGNQGESHPDAYRQSDLRQSYSDDEFPVRLPDIRKKSDYKDVAIPEGLKQIWPHPEQNSLSPNYEVRNKTALIRACGFSAGAHTTRRLLPECPAHVEGGHHHSGQDGTRFGQSPTFNPAIRDGTVTQSPENRRLPTRRLLPECTVKRQKCCSGKILPFREATDDFILTDEYGLVIQYARFHFFRTNACLSFAWKKSPKE